MDKYNIGGKIMVRSIRSGAISTVLALGLMASPHPAIADVVFSNVTGTDCQCGQIGPLEAEAFTPNADFDLTGIGMFLRNSPGKPATQMTFLLYSSDANHPLALLATTDAVTVPAVPGGPPGPPALFTASYNGPTVELLAGVQYWAGAVLDNVVWAGGGSPAVPWAYFENAAWTVGFNNNELQFEVLGDPADSVPEPATLALFGIGLAGLGFARRRKLN